MGDASEARLRVLVVEDHPEIGEVMLAMLEAIGHEGRHVASVAAARAAAEAESGSLGFDVVLADFRLPDGTGEDVLRLFQPRGVPVFLLSAYDRKTLAAQEGVGFAAVLEKPVDMEQLQTRLRGLDRRS